MLTIQGTRGVARRGSWPRSKRETRAIGGKRAGESVSRISVAETRGGTREGSLNGRSKASVTRAAANPPTEEDG